jgi:RNA polymerase sigma factor (sigma-70 family)
MTHAHDSWCEWRHGFHPYGGWDTIPSSGGVRDSSNKLVSDAWLLREQEGEIARAAEIRKLAIDQLTDDTYRSEGQKLGRPRVLTLEWDGPDDRQELDGLWPQRSDEQLAIQIAMESFINGLDGEERVVVRELSNGFTQRETAERLGLSQPTVHRRMQRALDKLSAALLERYAPEEEEPNE